MDTNLIVPENRKGKAVDIEHHVTEPTIEAAQQTFEEACNRLLDPSCWQDIGGFASASFKIWSAENTLVSRPLQQGDYLKVDIPGPGSTAGEGYDWVKVKQIAHNFLDTADGSLSITLMACENPSNKEDGTAHFFEEGATSTFIIKRVDKNVAVSYYGRNEVPNIKAFPLMDKVRNALIAIGASIGLSELQWTSLVKGMLKKSGQK